VNRGSRARSGGVAPWTELLELIGIRLPSSVLTREWSGSSIGAQQCHQDVSRMGMMIRSGSCRWPEGGTKRAIVVARLGAQEAVVSG
jgi:hypothetical protein